MQHDEHRGGEADRGEEPALPAAGVGQEAERRARVVDQRQVEEPGDHRHAFDDAQSVQHRDHLVSWSSATTHARRSRASQPRVAARSGIVAIALRSAGSGERARLAVAVQVAHAAPAEARDDRRVGADVRAPVPAALALGVAARRDGDARRRARRRRARACAREVISTKRRSSPSVASRSWSSPRHAQLDLGLQRRADARPRRAALRGCAAPRRGSRARAPTSAQQQVRARAPRRKSW